jgi:hypothetical protein
MAMILIALIHNNNQERMASCREVVRYLQSELSAAQHKVQIKEFWGQEPIQTASRLSWLKARLRAARSQYVYTRFHLQQGPRFWFPYLLGSLDIIQILSCTKKKLRFWEVEKIVTRKHISAWNAGSEFDFTIVVEDDALVSDGVGDFGEQFRSVILDATKKDNEAYIDIAGGYPLRLVAPRRVKVSGGTVFSQTLFTNTACVYGMNAPLLERFRTFVFENPEFLELGVDFLINAILSQRVSRLGTSVHFTQEIIAHGSMKGKYESWTLKQGTA